jgi:hypothetical protein
MSINRPLLAALGALTCFGLGLATQADAKPRKTIPAPVVAPPAATPTISPEQQRLDANAAQAKAAADQNAQNAANAQAYETALKARDEKIVRDKAEYDAKVAADKAAYEAVMKKWEADVAACKAGAVSRCAKPN